MTATQIMSIIGIVLSLLAYFCIGAFMYSDPEASSGWGIIVDMYLFAFSIVACVGANNANNKTQNNGR
jgi:hypothetical protein